MSFSCGPCSALIKPNIDAFPSSSVFSEASVLTWCSVPAILLWSTTAEWKIWADMNTDGHIKRINKNKSFIFLWRPNGPSKPLGDIVVGCVSHTRPMRWRIARQGRNAERGKQFTAPVLSHLRKCRRVWLGRRWFGLLLWASERHTLHCVKQIHWCCQITRGQLFKSNLALKCVLQCIFV